MCVCLEIIVGGLRERQQKNSQQYMSPVTPCLAYV